MGPRDPGIGVPSGLNSGASGPTALPSMGSPVSTGGRCRFAGHLRHGEQWNWPARRRRQWDRRARRRRSDRARGGALQLWSLQSARGPTEERSAAKQLAEPGAGAGGGPSVSGSSSASSVVATITSAHSGVAPSNQRPATRSDPPFIPAIPFASRHWGNLSVGNLTNWRRDERPSAASTTKWWIRAGTGGLSASGRLRGVTKTGADKPPVPPTMTGSSTGRSESTDSLGIGCKDCGGCELLPSDGVPDWAK